MSSASGTERTESTVLSGEIEVSDEKNWGDTAHYQHLWVKDTFGSNAVFAKVNRRVCGVGDECTDGVLLCDLEVSPKHRGKGVAVEFLRLLKEHYALEVVFSTSSFSSDGYRFFLRSQEHQKRTGERLMAISPGYPQRITVPREGTKYCFVKDWETRTVAFEL